MIYFKHPELSDKYHVSLKTIHNWIDGAKQGKVALKLHTVSNRTYIANTPENILALTKLAEKGKKYRNTLHHKTIQPEPAIYDILSRRQILDVINNLNVHKELPKQYDYLQDGASNWDNWIKRLAKEDASANLLKGTLELIHANMAVIDRLLVDNKKVNVIDLGVGNAYPVKELLAHLVELGILHRYIAIDISPAMLEIAKRNVKEWFGEDFPYEGYVRDITHEQFDDLLVDDMLDNKGEETTNLVLMLGGTPTNFRSYGSAFRAAYNSMGSNDLIMHTIKPDTETARQYFDFNSTPNSNDKLSPGDQNGYLLSLLNIDPSLYDVERGFDPTQMIRYVRIRLKASITVQFTFDKKKRTVSLEKGDTVLLHRIMHLSALEIISEFEKLGFTLLQSSLTKDRQYLLTICGLETINRTDS